MTNRTSPSLLRWIAAFLCFVLCAGTALPVLAQDSVPSAETTAAVEDTTLAVDPETDPETEPETEPAVRYAVAFVGEVAVHSGLLATQGTPYTFTVPAEEGYAYAVTEFRIGGEAYTGYTTDGENYFVPGEDITGDLYIVVTKTAVAAETFTVTVAGDESAACTVEKTPVLKGESARITVNEEEGYYYVVTATMGTGFPFVTKEGDTYTVTNVSDNVVFTVSRTKEEATGSTNGNLTVGDTDPGVTDPGYIMGTSAAGTPLGYLGSFTGFSVSTPVVDTSSAGVLAYAPGAWLVRIGTAKLSGRSYVYNGARMVWSNKYSAYVTVVISDSIPSLAASQFAIVESTTQTMQYNRDANMTGKVDANDAQLIYNMYNGMYQSLYQLPVEKFIRADMDGNGMVDVQDALLSLYATDAAVCPEAGWSVVTTDYPDVTQMYAPTVDGNITLAEWDFPTYRETLGGASQPEYVDLWWGFDDAQENFYTAVRLVVSPGKYASYVSTTEGAFVRFFFDRAGTGTIMYQSTAGVYNAAPNCDHMCYFGFNAAGDLVFSDAHGIIAAQGWEYDGTLRRDGSGNYVIDFEVRIPRDSTTEGAFSKIGTGEGRPFGVIYTLNGVETRARNMEFTFPMDQTEVSLPATDSPVVGTMTAFEVDGNLSAAEWVSNPYRTTFGDSSPVQYIDLYWGTDNTKMYIGGKVVTTVFSYGTASTPWGGSYLQLFMDADANGLIMFRSDNHVYGSRLGLLSVNADGTANTVYRLKEYEFPVAMQVTGGQNGEPYEISFEIEVSYVSGYNDAMFAFIGTGKSLPLGVQFVPGPGETTVAVRKNFLFPAPANKTIAPGSTFTVTVGEPVLVFQDSVGEQWWGAHQFPSIAYTKYGWLRVSWNHGEDVVGAAPATLYSRYSTDNGLTWYESSDGGEGFMTEFMPNGKMVHGFVNGGTKTGLDLSEYSVAANFNGVKLYFAEDMVGDAALADVISLQYTEYDPAITSGNRYNTVNCTLNWPYAAVGVYSDSIVYTLSGRFGQSNDNIMVVGDKLYTCFYGPGFNSMASSRTEALDILPYSSVYVFESPDNGRTWNFIYQFMPTESVMSQSQNYGSCTGDFAGFEEPEMIVLPNGDLFILLRTGMTRTMFYSRSTDGGVTWTDPAPFDDMGVLPQLLTLPCGVTLASYGRPELRIRATSDPAGIVWQDPVTIPLSIPYTGTDNDIYSHSCFYTGLVTLDSNTALLVHADFRYPKSGGGYARSILVRTVTVMPSE